MQNAFRFFFQSLILILAFQVNIGAQGFASEGDVGKIVAKKQVVTIFRNGAKLSVNGFGAILKEEDIIQTESRGKATITLKSGDKIFIAPSTRIKLSDLMPRKEKSKTTGIIDLLYGKVRAQIKKMRKSDVRLRTTTAVIGVKGTDFIVKFEDKITTVGTIEGLVNLSSLKTSKSIDISSGKMSSVSPAGEVMPVSEFAGELLENVEFAGNKMKEEDISGEQIKL